VSLSGALMPGPLLTVTLKESLGRGAVAGPLVVLGHGLLELAMVGALLFGLQHWLRLPVVEFCLSLAGAAVLVWMARGLLGGLGNKFSLSLEEKSPGVTSTSRRTFFRPVWAGVLASAANPYWELWWATIGAAMLSQAQVAGAVGVAAFYFGHVLGDLGWYTAVSSAVGLGRRWLTPAVYRGLLFTCGLFLLGLAVYFAWHGIGVGKSVLGLTLT
jgi:threonine/homoserine/homoserine lactone efflux protein